ncbi:MAG: hypothetical protein IKM97_06070 [Clostridia bacterium]|nr:hypothetical protein [Clostridia bacterium]
MSTKKLYNKRLMIIFFGLLILIIFSTILKKNSNKVNIEDNLENLNVISVVDESVLENSESMELERIKSMEERTRIEYYVANYLKLIENEQFDKAYRLLNREYRKNYFRTQDEFEEYCNKTFSKMLHIEYDNFERNGDIYVLWITINDAINGKRNEGKQMNFVVKENNFNDYELSFSKI